MQFPAICANKSHRLKHCSCNHVFSLLQSSISITDISNCHRAVPTYWILSPAFSHCSVYVSQRLTVRYNTCTVFQKAPFVCYSSTAFDDFCGNVNETLRFETSMRPRPMHFWPRDIVTGRERSQPRHLLYDNVCPIVRLSVTRVGHA